ncbi:DUF6385 domain-containing protein [Kineothrix sedimenti]|uniref:DUF6385 domain-containing protein n=1 Tax=Kineothrix sedimenti TaxID=3123317 RepID=A0ABZ3EPX1_9FIRM
MNNLVFNTTASQLLSSVYGYNQGTGTLQLLQLNSAGELLVASASMTVAGDVTITNALLTVAGDVTIANPITIANGSLTVNGEISVEGDVTITNALLTVAGDVTVANPITIANSNLTVLVQGNEFFSATDPHNGASSTGIALAATDISQLRTATMFVNNTGTNAITVTLQISPDGVIYFDDVKYDDVLVAGGSYTIMVVETFAQYAQISYDAGTLATFTAYYNGQA